MSIECVCMYMHEYVSVCACMCVCECMYVCVWVCEYVWVCVHVRRVNEIFRHFFIWQKWKCWQLSLFLSHLSVSLRSENTMNSWRRLWYEQTECDPLGGLVPAQLLSTVDGLFFRSPSPCLPFPTRKRESETVSPEMVSCHSALSITPPDQGVEGWSGALRHTLQPETSKPSIQN